MVKGDRSERRKANREMTEEETDELYQFLQGKGLEDWTIEHRPALDPDTAYAVIYILQEHYGIIPDHYEQCAKCKSLFDTHNAGGIIDEDEATEDNPAGTYCDWHYNPPPMEEDGE